MAIKTYAGFGEQKTIREWADHLGVKYGYVYEYINMGESIENIAARVKGKHERGKMYAGFGESHSCAEWARRFGIRRTTMYNYLVYNSLTVEQVADRRGIEYTPNNAG